MNVTAQVPDQYQIDFRSDLNTEKNRLTVKSIKDPFLKKNEESIDKIHGHILISNENQKNFSFVLSASCIIHLLL